LRQLTVTRQLTLAFLVGNDSLGEKKKRVDREGEVLSMVHNLIVVASNFATPQT